jgi:acyl carrier protein
MNASLFDEIARILTTQFAVDPALVRPETTLAQLGLDSLNLMEFVFAVEDRFSVRVPEDRLDPRQAGITLEHLAQVLEEQVLVGSIGDVKTA